VRNKNKTKHTFPLPPLLSRLNFSPDSSPPRSADGWGMGLQSVHNTSGLLMLFRCSVVGSLPWDIVLYELLQHGSFPWGAVLPELLWCVSPTVCSSCQDPAPTWALHRLQLPSGHIHLMQHWVLHGQKNGCLLACGLLQAARGCSTTRSSPWAAGESLLGLLEHLLPLLLH